MKKLPIYNLYTFGHSNRPINVFISKLKENKVDVLVDVRTNPFSRWFPQYNKLALEHSLETQSIQYLYRGQNLGGKGQNTGYDEAIDELTNLAKGGKKVCVVCSEADYHKCHRYTTLTPSFENRGLSVTHIEYEKPTRHN
jgi:uncharacterized protein (DUF488 family)